MTTLVAALVGGLTGLGVFMLVVVALGRPALTGRFLRAPIRLPMWARDRLVLRVSVGACTAIFTWLATGWPAGALIVGLGAAASPSLVGARARREANVARIEALAAWAEQLRDVMAAADGIQSAIVTTAPLCPAAIGSEVRRLADGLVARERLAPLLHRFADEMAHPLADMIVTSLLIASERQGRLSDLLGEVAASARATATMRLRVEAGRARTYVTTKLIVGVTIGIAVWLVVLRRDYLKPFDSASGQVMLVIIGLVFAVSGVLMQRMARPAEPGRMLSSAGSEGGWP